jgi:hypothetical protein
MLLSPHRMQDFLPIHGKRPQPIPPHLRLPPRPPTLSPPPLANQGLIRVAYSDASTGVYLGSPAITKLDADTIIVAHVRLGGVRQWSPLPLS